MLRNDYFVECLQANKFRELGWINSILAVTNLKQVANTSLDGLLPYELLAGEDERFWFYDPVANKLNPIEDATIGEPMYYRKEIIKLPPGAINVLPEQGIVTTTVGNALTNAIIFFHPLGTRVPYFNGGKDGKIDKIDPGDISKKVTALVLGNDETEGKDPQSYISIRQLQDWMQAVTWIGGLATIVTAGYSEKSIRIDPAVIKRRDELYEQYKDQLGDGAVQALIEAELIKMDKASLKDDPAFDFYYKHDKHWANSRKKTLITTGNISSIGGNTNFIAKPLSAGIDAEDIPAYSDSIRHASYSRGHLTALGGELVKYIYRVTQNIKIVEPDCGSLFGISDIILEGYQSMYMGRYVMEGKKIIELTAENISQYMNKLIYLRSPAYCKTLNKNYCQICMGKELSRTPKAIHTAAAEPGSVMMNASMKAMHGKASKTIKFDFRTAIT